MRPGKDVLPGVAPDVSFADSDDGGTAGTLASGANAGTRTSQVGIDDGKQGSLPSAKPTARKGLPFDEEAKLVYGILFSLRNMVKKLSSKE